MGNLTTLNFSLGEDIDMLRDTITPAEAKLLQLGSEGLDLVRELLPTPTHGLFAEYDREPVGESRGRLCKQRRNCEIAEWRIRCAADVRVRLGMSHFSLLWLFANEGTTTARQSIFLANRVANRAKMEG